MAEVDLLAKGRLEIPYGTDRAVYHERLPHSFRLHLPTGQIHQHHVHLGIGHPTPVRAK